jgi:sugar lactone lactonase YvrE
MFAHRDRIYYRGLRWGALLATLGLIMFPAVERGMAQTATITLGSLNSPPASAGVPFPLTPVGSTSAALTLPLQINLAGTAINGVSAAVSQGGNQEYAVTSTGCALNTALSAGTICNVTATFTPAYPGWRSVPLQVVTSSGTFNFGMIGLGTGPQVALTPATIHTIAGNGFPGYSGDGGAATNATVYAPAGMALDAAGNLYFADFLNNVVRKIAAGTGIVTTVAGNGTAGFSGDHGPAIAAEMNGPYGVALDSAGNLYIADSQNCFIRKVIAATGIITTVVGIGNFPRIMGVPTAPRGYSGDGYAATDAWMNSPQGVAVDHAGNIYVADTGNNVVREVNASTNIITTVVGNHKQGYSGDNGPAVSAELYSPISVAADTGGNIFIVDADNNRVREVATGTGIITTVAGNGTAGYSGDGGAATSSERNSPASI